MAILNVFTIETPDIAGVASDRRGETTLYAADFGKKVLCNDDLTIPVAPVEDVSRTQTVINVTGTALTLTEEAGVTIKGQTTVPPYGAVDLVVLSTTGLSTTWIASEAAVGKADAADIGVRTYASYTEEELLNLAVDTPVLATDSNIYKLAADAKAEQLADAADATARDNTTATHGQWLQQLSPAQAYYYSTISDPAAWVAWNGTDPIPADAKIAPAAGVSSWVESAGKIRRISTVDQSELLLKEKETTVNPDKQIEFGKDGSGLIVVNSTTPVDFRRYAKTATFGTDVDYWPALQDAVADATARSGLELVISPGYLDGAGLNLDIAGKLDLPSNFTLRANGVLMIIQSTSHDLFYLEGEKEKISLEGVYVSDPNNALQVQSILDTTTGSVYKNIYADVVLEGPVATSDTTLSLANCIVLRGTGEDIDLIVRGKRHQNTINFPETGSHKNVKINCKVQECHGAVMQIGGVIDNLDMQFDIGQLSEFQLARDPINFSAVEGTLVNDLTIHPSRVVGRQGVSTIAGVRNGAWGDAVAIRNTKNGFVYGVKLHHLGKYGIDVVDGCENVTVAGCQFTDIDGSGLVIGSAIGDTVKKCVAFGNTFLRCGLDGQGVYTGLNKAGIRVVNTEAAHVYGNNYQDCEYGEWFEQSTNVSHAPGTYGNVPNPVTKLNSASFVGAQTERVLENQPCYVDYRSASDWHQSSTLPNVTGNETEMTISSLIIVDSVRPATENWILGSVSSRILIKLNPDGTVYFRLRSNTGGEVGSSPNPLPAWLAGHRFWLQTRWNAVAGTVESFYSVDNAASESEVENWVSVGSFAVSNAPIFAAWDTTTLYIAYGGSPGQTGILKLFGCSGRAGTTTLWDFQAGRIVGMRDKGMRSLVSGETWTSAGNIVTEVDTAQDAKLFIYGPYADDAAAGADGLDSGSVYRTTTGELRVKL